MSFSVGDKAVHPAHGVGEITQPEYRIRARGTQAGNEPDQASDADDDNDNDDESEDKVFEDDVQSRSKSLS